MEKVWNIGLRIVRDDNKIDINNEYLIGKVNFYILLGVIGKY